MDRRIFLQRSVLAGFALTITPIVPRPQRPSEAPGDCADRVPAPVLTDPGKRAAWRSEQLTAAWRRAAASGSPLLLIVVPDEPSERAVQADAWGQAISHGSDGFIDALLQAELATATQAEISRVIPDYVPQAASLVLVSPCALPVTWRAVSIPFLAQEAAAAKQPLPDEPDERYRELADRRQRRYDEDTIDARIAAVEAAVLGVLPAPEAGEEAPRQERRKAVIPGARWGNNWGCGTDFETKDPLVDEEGWGVDCGMGHVNARAARFLSFLTDEPS